VWSQSCRFIQGEDYTAAQVIKSLSQAENTTPKLSGAKADNHVGTDTSVQTPDAARSSNLTHPGADFDAHS